MADNRLRGDAQDIAQVTTFTVGGTPADTQVYTFTANRKEIAYTADALDDNDSIAEAAQVLLAASSIPEFKLATFEVDSAVITGTASTAGRPFTITSGATGTGTLVASTTTASKGHWHWDDPDNWSAGTIPAAGEDVYLEDVSSDVRYGIDQNAVALASLNIARSFTGGLGLDSQNPEGYTEFLETSLKIRPTILNIGYGVGSGSPFMRIHTGSAAAVTVNVTSTGTPANQSSKALMLQGSHASNVLNIKQGSVGCAMFSGETSNFPVTRIGSDGSPATDVDLYGGAGASWTTITQVGGSANLSSNVTTWTKYGGSSVVNGSAAVATLVQDGQASHVWQSNGTLGSGTFRGEGSSLDASGDLRAKTLSASTFIGGAYFVDPAKTITFTAAFLTDQASLLAIAQKSGLGSGQFSLQRS